MLDFSHSGEGDSLDANGRHIVGGALGSTRVVPRRRVRPASSQSSAVRLVLARRSGRPRDFVAASQRTPSRTWPGSRAASGRAAERVDQQGEPRPANAVLLAVLDPGDHGLVDAGLRLEEPLGPPERHARRRLIVGPDQVEAVLLLRVAGPAEPSHRREPSDGRLTCRISGDHTADHPTTRYAVHGIRESRSRRWAIKHRSGVDTGGRSRQHSGGAGLRRAGPRRRPINAFRGSVEPMMQTNRAGA